MDPHRELFRGLLITWTLLSVLLVGCGSHLTDKESQPSISVWLPRIQTMYAPRKLEWSTQELRTLSSTTPLRGLVAEIWLQGELGPQGPVGIRPYLKGFFDSRGIWVGRDVHSLRLISLYATFEKLWEIDGELGLRSYLKWPRQVFFDTKVKLGENVSHNNARYSPEWDIYIFEPYTLSELDLVINPGVVAHEHFHALFHHIVTQSVSDQGLKQALLKSPEISSGPSKPQPDFAPVDLSSAIYIHYLVRAWNEALADVWAWLVTGDTHFVERSIPSEKGRSLDGDTPPSLLTKKQLLDVLLSNPAPAVRLYFSYQLGSQMAKQLYQTLKTQDRNTSRKNLTLFISKLSQEVNTWSMPLSNPDAATNPETPRLEKLPEPSWIVEQLKNQQQEAFEASIHEHPGNNLRALEIKHEK